MQQRSRTPTGCDGQACGVGAIATSPHVIHTYDPNAGPAVYEVVLLTADENLLSGTRAIQLKDAPTSIEDFVVSPFTIALGQPVELAGSGSSSDVVLWKWEKVANDKGNKRGTLVKKQVQSKLVISWEQGQQCREWAY